MAVVFDIDNTLIDSRKRFHLSLKEAANGRKINEFKELTPEEREKFWNIFLSDKYIENDLPIQPAIDELVKRYRDGFTIIILTGRPESMLEATLDQLRRYQIPFHRLYMRPMGDTNPDYIYKPLQLKKIMAEGYDIIEYHEDSIKTVERVKSLYPNIKVCVHGFGEFFEV